MAEKNLYPRALRLVGALDLDGPAKLNLINLITYLDEAKLGSLTKILEDYRQGLERDDQVFEKKLSQTSQSFKQRRSNLVQSFQNKLSLFNAEIEEAEKEGRIQSLKNKIQAS